MFRLTGTMNSVFQSMPFIVIQVLNNSENNNWNELNSFCIGTTASSLFFTCIKLIFVVEECRDNKHQTIYSDIKIKHNQIVDNSFENKIPENNINEIQYQTIGGKTLINTDLLTGLN